MSHRELSTGPGLQITHDPQTDHPTKSLGIIWNESGDHLSKVWGSFRQVWGSPMIPHQPKDTNPTTPTTTPTHRTRLRTQLTTASGRAGSKINLSNSELKGN